MMENHHGRARKLEGVSGTILGNHKDLGIIYLPITHSEKTS
jgi:hypothetical protein